MNSFLKRALLSFERQGFFNLLPDRLYLQLMFRTNMDQKLDLKNPKTFNQKLQWLKLYDRKPQYTDMVDKYEAKRYVAGRIGEEYIIPTYGVWDKFEDIDFDALPDQFVLKCTHDCGGLVICRDKSKLDKEAARVKIDKCLKRNYYYHGREWPYKNVKPRILAEKYITADGKVPEDYKIFCFNGKAKMILMCAERFDDSGLKENFYDLDWNLLEVQRLLHGNTQYPIPRPKQLEKMLSLAESLAKEESFLRVDFYDVNGQLYFGELTFFPTSGWGPFVPEKWDMTFGEWIELPKLKIE